MSASVFVGVYRERSGSGLVAFTRFSKGQSLVLELPTSSASPAVFGCVHWSLFLTLPKMIDQPMSHLQILGYTVPRPLLCPVADVICPLAPSHTEPMGLFPVLA